MIDLVFATQNPHKVQEVNAILGSLFRVRSLKEIGCHEDIPETSPTLEGNALLKAQYVYEKFGLDCFSEDTGLEIHSLGGEPGVRSARYAGSLKDPEDNMQLVLDKLRNSTDRSARFRTVIALILDGNTYTFEGIVNGEIRKEKSGAGGFGYDPIFQPEGFDVTFAEMDPVTKNRISHRGKAVHKLVAFLKSISD